MLPHDKRRNNAAAVDPMNDLTGEAMKRCMSRFISAVQSGDATAALQAFKELDALNEYLEPEMDD